MEEIQGDLHELFSIRSGEQGHFTASWKYAWDVLRFFRLSNIRSVKTQNNSTMTLNYFKTGWRQLKSQPSTTFINISGLALAIGLAITVFIFQDHFTHMDRFHKNDIYQVLNHVEGDDEVEVWSDISLSVLDQLKFSSPAVKRATMIEYGEANVRYKEDVFREFVWFVEPEYLQMFDFPVKYGNRDGLEEKSAIAVTREKALKYFGRDDVLGEVLHVKLEGDVLASFTIAVVLDDIPKRASFGGDILIPVVNLFDIPGRERSDLTYLTDGVFFELAEGYAVSDVESLYAPFIADYNNASDRWQTVRFETVPLYDLSVRQIDIEGSIAGGAHPSGRIALTIIAGLLLLLACFNYINIAVSSASRRLKEIALRKVMGGYQHQITRQFLVENLLVCLMALILGVALCYFVLLPGFRESLPIYIPFSFTSWKTAVIFFVVLIAFVTLASGAYPAFYISRFRPAAIFRGNERFGNRQVLSKVLMVLQLVIAFSTIVACLVFNVNAVQMAQRDWGYVPDEVIAVPLMNQQQAEVMTSTISQWSDVSHVESSFGHVGDYNRLTQVNHHDLTVNAFMYSVGSQYADIMGMEIVEGRWIMETDKTGAQTVVINEKLAERLNLEHPLEETLIHDSVEYQVVGVVKDFYQQIYFMELLPTMFFPVKASEVNYVSLKVKEGKSREVNERLAKLWHTVAPNDPYDGFYQQEVMDEFFRENEANIMLLSVISGMALFLACIGLYGLVSFQVSRKMKEISVRKVLGAGMGHLSYVINRDYYWMLGIAIVVGLPSGYLLIDQLIQSIYPDPEPTTIWPFVLSVSVLGIAIMITLGSQLLRVRKENPVNILRSE